MSSFDDWDEIVAITHGEIEFCFNFSPFHTIENYTLDILEEWRSIKLKSFVLEKTTVITGIIILAIKFEFVNLIVFLLHLNPSQVMLVN